MSALASSSSRLAEFAPQLEGSFIDRVLYGASGSRDCLDVWLAREPGLGDFVLSFEVARFLSISKLEEIEQSFIDEVRVFLLPQEGAWPEGAEQRVRRFPGLPELIWVRLIGPAEVDVISQVLTISRQIGSQ
jgi:hypothetical protein